MFKHPILAAVVLVGATFSLPSMAADEPTLQQVYQAAEHGQMDAAQGMMATVLKDHPNSAKAHFVEAELLAKQNRFSEASAELATAKGISPDLSFAKPEAVANLERRLSGGASGAMASAPYATQRASVPWGMIIIGIGVFFAVIYFVRALGARRQPIYTGGNGMPGQGGSMAPPYGGSPYGGMPPSGGIGGNIVGGLASGLAVGAGVVAGEALMHRMMDGEQHSNSNAAYGDAQQPDNMGGDNFGVSDSSSWDNSSGGSSDFGDSFGGGDSGGDWS